MMTGVVGLGEVGYESGMAMRMHRGGTHEEMPLPVILVVDGAA